MAHGSQLFISRQPQTRKAEKGEEMKGTFKINGEDMELVANAASPYIYKQVFQEDFLIATTKEEPDPQLMEKMAYVMYKQAEVSDISQLMKLSLDGFYKWLEGFEPMTFVDGELVQELTNFYFKQTKSSAIPKNEGA